MVNVNYKEIAEIIYKSSLEARSEKDSLSFSKNIASFLNKKGLISKSKIIFQKIEEIMNKERGILKVLLISPYKLEESYKEKIAKELKRIYEANTIVFNEKLDPSLLDGFVLKMNNQIIDFSLSSKLKSLKNYLYK